MYYYAYLAEGITKPTTYTIAPGCAAAHSVPRCNFNQFLEYIWTPDARTGEPATPPIKVNILDDFDGEPKSNGKSFVDITPNSLKNRIESFHDDAAKSGGNTVMRKITNEIASSRLVDGSTGWYDAMSKVTKPIGDLANMRAKGLISPVIDTTGLVEKILKNGLDSAAVVRDLRMKDLEGFRLNSLRDPAKGNIPVKTVNGRRTLNIATPYKTLSAKETVQEIKTARGFTTDAQAEAVLDDVLRKWLNGDFATDPSKKDQPLAHMNAVNAVDTAEKACTCSGP